MDFQKYLELREKAFQLVKNTSGEEMRWHSPVPNQPYWTHMMNVHNYLVIKGVNEYETLLAAILHDILEDSNVTYEDIATQFTPRVAEIVSVVTKKKKNYNDEEYYKNIFTFQYPAGMEIKVADRMDNMMTEYLYSAERKSTVEKVEETEKYILPMAQKIGWEKNLTNAIEFYRLHIRITT
jgi:GTP pyrophosphokinase